mgnify:CR=1 FL=1
MANYDFPTEIIDLPSKGKCYEESNPLSKGSVEIKYMTAKEEDKNKIQDLIKIAEEETKNKDINDQVKFLVDQKIDVLRSIN